MSNESGLQRALESLIYALGPVLRMKDDRAFATGKFGAMPAATDILRGGVMRTEGANDAVAYALYKAGVPTIVYPLLSTTGNYSGGASYTDEEARDAIAAALVAGNNIDITVDDAADTITIDVETLVTADISDVTASAAELNFVDGVTSAIQTQLDAKQPLDADLTTIAGLTATTNNFMVASSSAWASRTPTQAIAHLGLDADIATLALPANTTISTFGASIIDDANEAAFKATVNLEIGTDVQAWSANLDEYAAVNPTAAGLALLDDANAAAQIATLGLDADIATFSLPASTTISTFGASLVDDAASSNARTTLGLVIGTDVQAFNARLAEIAALADPNADRMLVWDDSADDLIYATPTKSVNIMIGDGTNVVPTGVWCDIRMPTAGVITKNSLLATKPGGNVSIVVDLWKDTFANYPPTVADTITASAKPTLSTDDESEDATLTGWTTTFAAGDIIRVNVDSASTVTLACLALDYRETY